MLFDTLKTLCELNGTSGREDAVREEILRRIDGKCDSCQVDPMGNIIVFKKGAKRRPQKLLLDAHMDEVGFMVTGYTEDGMLRFQTVGGMIPTVILGRSVSVGEKGYIGVIGTKPIHLQSKEERGTVVPVDKLYFDIGAEDTEDVKKYVEIGDSAYFVSDYREFGEDMVKAKAIDDRIGCAVLIELLQQDLEYDTWFSFSVQEEVGCRGAAAVAYTVQPDLAVCIEGTTASDVAGVTGDKRVCEVGKGAVVSFMDHGTIYDRALYQEVRGIADQCGIPNQTKTMVAGGNNSGKIHLSAGGVRTTAVSVPTRYIHSPSSVAKKSDMQAVYDLVAELVNRLGVEEA
jgi:endoglucanase